jgi:drug/metabolite transporter (DMT)-like permease
LAILLAVFYRKVNIKKVNKKEYGQMFLNGIFSSVEYVAKFFAIASIGIVKTSLVMLVAPIIILVFSKMFLKEKITMKRGIGDLIIIICVAATFLPFK